MASATAVFSSVVELSCQRLDLDKLRPEDIQNSSSITHVIASITRGYAFKGMMTLSDMSKEFSLSTLGELELKVLSAVIWFRMHRL